MVSVCVCVCGVRICLQMELEIWKGGTTKIAPCTALNPSPILTIPTHQLIFKVFFFFFFYDSRPTLPLILPTYVLLPTIPTYLLPMNYLLLLLPTKKKLWLNIFFTRICALPLPLFPSKSFYFSTKLGIGYWVFSHQFLILLLLLLLIPPLLQKKVVCVCGLWIYFFFKSALPLPFISSKYFKGINILYTLYIYYREKVQTEKKNRLARLFLLSPSSSPFPLPPLLLLLLLLLHLFFLSFLQFFSSN